MNTKPERTLYDIAKQWGLHPATVYKHADKIGLIHEKTGKIVDLNYQEQVALERHLRNRRHPGRPVVNDGECKIESCFAMPRARGMCNTHYEHWRIYGHPTEKRKKYKCAACGEWRDRKAKDMCNRCYKRSRAATHPPGAR